MDARVPQLRAAMAWLTALLVTLAVTLLWLPRPDLRTRAPDAALATATLKSDKGQAPRAALLARAGAEDRNAGPLPGLALAEFAPPPRTVPPAAPLWRLAPRPCPPGAACTPQNPRAPPAGA